MRYRKKPIVIDAIQWTGENIDEVCEFVPQEIWNCITDKKLDIRTLEGVMVVSNGDYIIKGIKGEFYPCKPDIFESSYEKVEK